MRLDEKVMLQRVGAGIVGTSSYVHRGYIRRNTMDQTTQTSLLSSLSNQLADAVESAGRSIVLVNGRQRHPTSGVVIAADTVLTADHGVERDEDLTVLTA